MHFAMSEVKRHFWKSLLLISTVLVLFTWMNQCQVMAQMGQLSGTITYKEKTDDVAVPRSDVDIVILRKDIKGRWTTKTDKKGRYFYSVPAFGIYVVVAHGKGLKATIGKAIQMSGELKEVNLEVIPGDGSCPTDEQILANIVNAKENPGYTKEQLEQFEKAKAEQERIKAENEKAAANFNEMKKHFDAALELDAKKDYEGAVTEYRQASVLDATQHSIWGNLSQALFNVGATKFNNKQRDEACKLFLESAEAGQKAAGLNATEANYKVFAARALALRGQYCQDFESLEKAAKLYKEAAEMQTVPQEKNKLLIKVSEMYFNAGQLDNSINLYRSVLASDTNNLDAMFGLAVALTSDPSKQQECISLFERVVNSAPADSKLKKDAAEFVKTLKEATKPNSKKK